MSAGWTRPEGEPLVIIDRSGRRVWPLLRDAIPEPLAVCSSVDPWQLASDVRAALEAGVRYVICVGGDGAYLGAAAGSRGVEGVLIGHGGGPASLPRSVGLPADPYLAARHLVAVDSLPLDTVLIAPRRGEPSEMLNIALVGLFRAAGYMGGKFGRWRTGLRIGGLWPFRDTIEIRMGNLTREMRASGLVVANGQFLGDASLVPRAHPGDGKLEVLVFEGPARDVWRMLPRLGTGTHLPHPHVRELRPAAADVDGTGRIYADGVDIGRLPARFEVVPERLRIAL